MRLSEPLARLLDRTGANRALARGPGPALIALAYHRIGDPGGSGDRELWSATQDELAEHVEFIARRFEIVLPSEVPDAIAERHGRFAVITFDDGYRDNYDAALPVLQAQGARAGFFVTTGFLDGSRTAWWDEIAALLRSSPHRELPAREWFGSPLRLDGDRSAAIRRATDRFKLLPREQAERFLDYLRIASEAEAHAARPDQWMTWEMARGLRDAGMEVGAHTVSHPVLAGLSAGEQRSEIIRSIDRIAAELGAAPRTFSYPVGRPESFNDASRSVLEAAGIDAAFTCHGGAVNRRNFDPLAIPRIPIGAVHSPERVKARIAAPRVFARS